MTDLLPKHPQHGLVCCFLEFPVRKTATIYPKMIGPFPNPTKKGAVCIFLFHVGQKVWLQTAPEIFSIICTFFCSPIMPLQSERPPSKHLQYGLVFCDFLCFAEDAPREVFKQKLGVKYHTFVFIWFFYSTSPIMPPQKDMLPSKHLQNGLALLFFSSQKCSLRLWAVRNCLGC